MSKLLIQAFNTILFVTSFTHVAAAENIVVVGDSLSCGPFGIQMVKDLSAGGKNKVTLFCAVSATPTDWLKGRIPQYSDGCHMLTSEKVNSLYPQELCPNPKNPSHSPTLISGRCPSSLSESTQMPSLSSILSQNPGAKVVVALGTNSLANGRTDPSYRAFATEIRSAGNKCDWVSPPHCRPDQDNPKVFKLATVKLDEANVNNFTDSLKSSIANHVGKNGDQYCGFVDSSVLTLPETDPSLDADETVDGVHRTNCAGKIWAGKVKQKLMDADSAATQNATQDGQQ